MFNLRNMRLLLSGFASAWLLACAGLPPAPPTPQNRPAETEAPKPAPADPAPSPAASGKQAQRIFPQAVGLDTLLDARPHKLPAVKLTAARASEDPEKTGDGKVSAAGGPEGGFRIQVDALSDIDAAQARKSVLEIKLGVKIDMTFDAPYYKLRFGGFATRREAEDKLVELAGKNVQGFIVRQ